MKSNVMLGHDQLLHGLLDRFCNEYSEIEFVGGTQNILYRFKIVKEFFYLRLTPINNRSEQLVNSELDWILFLAGQGVSVSLPRMWKSGNYTEMLSLEDEHYVCVIFEEAVGQFATYPNCLQDTHLYENLGIFTGKLHAKSKIYEPHPKITARHHWFNNWFISHVNLLPETQTRVRDSLDKLINDIKQLPINKEVYGLTHGDMGVSNFKINEGGQITLFDFDEAQYSWFVEDIAVQLYYMVYVYGGAEGKSLREAQAYLFMKHFMFGYNQENTLDDYWLKQLPLFLRLRELIVYIGCFRSWDGDETFSSSDNQWFKDWIYESKCRIEAEEAIVDIWSL